jgi:hypothetical protein
MNNREKYLAPDGEMTINEDGQLVRTKARGYLFCKYLGKVIDVGYCYEIAHWGVREDCHPDKVSYKEAAPICETCQFC